MRVHYPSGPLCSLKTAGYTLIELIVVLVLLTLAAAVVGPSLLPSRPEPGSELRTLIGNTKRASIRRGEMVRLRIDRAGNWQAEAGTSGIGEVLMVGKFGQAPASPVDLIFSPLGTCGSALESGPADLIASFDPLTCEMKPE